MFAKNISYAVISKAVLYDREVPNSAKLLYGIIAGCIDQNRECRITNKELSFHVWEKGRSGKKLTFNRKMRWIAEDLRHLEKSGHIHTFSEKCSKEKRENMQCRVIKIMEA